MTETMRQRLTEIFLPLQGTEKTARLVSLIGTFVDKVHPGPMGAEVIDSLIVAHGITGADADYLAKVKDTFKW